MTTLADFDYEDIKVIGRGQYGKAHLVRAAKEQVCYIAKTIDLTCLSSKEKENALQEVMLLRRLDHPNIVEYKDNFFMADTLVIVMLYCEGGDLQTYIKEKCKERQRIREDQIMHYFVQVLQALQYIHGERILHRDLKTSNLFLTQSKRVVKLGDFGISRVLEGTIQAAVTVVGTPYYMSPEVCENKPYTFKSDVWSLGCVLYELCMLKHAFSADNLLGLVYKIVSDKYDPIPKMYSKQLNVLIQRTLEKSADKRPSVRDLMQDPFVHNFMNDYLKSKGSKSRQGQAVSGVRSRQQAAAAPAAAATAAAAGSETPVAPQPAAASAEAREPPRAKPKRVASSGGSAAGEPRKMETPKEAALRRKKEVADRQLAELKVATKEAEHNKLVAKQMKETEFQSTRTGQGVRVARSVAAAVQESPPPVEHVADTIEEDPQEEEEYSEDEYEDDWEECGESEEEEGASEGEDVREQQDYSRVMKNYEQDLMRAHAGSSPQRQSSASMSVEDRPVGPSAATMNMKARSEKLRENLVQKLGAETFDKVFTFLLKAREDDIEPKLVQRELNTLLGKEKSRLYGLDLDQLVFQQVNCA